MTQSQYIINSKLNILGLGKTLGNIKGLNVLIQPFTAPGRLVFNAARKLALKGVGFSKVRERQPR